MSDGSQTLPPPEVKKPYQEAEAPLDEGGAKNARRREQVRRAQRTHRDRKATYVKTLESEVAKLRAKDSAHEAHLLAYRALIRGLKDLIKQYNITLPHDLASDPLISSPEATVEIFDLADRSQSIRAYFPDGYLSSSNPTATATAPPFISPTSAGAAITTASMPFPAGSTSSSDFLLTGLTISDAPSLSQDHSSQSGVSVTMPVFHPQGLGATQVGIDFVLALEYVCLKHHASHFDDADGSGHEMMLLSPIMCRSPPLDVSLQPGSGLASGAKWTVPAVELEKLLEFSDRLNLSGELTPVEIWQRVRQHPNFSLLTRDTLEILKLTLVPEVKCYG
ncbi:uncharacterized protein A1O9_09096 [Exophiala aquamarina CBS 119918]|uniref:BZIP domain-containing protein n=1 Tax=Exophiala aquamarina CBS 119918 TaxID=1182545 RepID=A0A072P3E6_9EURO|nr:uncharacterized protein A1O9_09096 [Exophiala aquamarina CBS 119918]KEF54654.1 hypothetical protein A1O9_09096 [Exophiala aquamarina CBS 119918]